MLFSTLKQYSIISTVYLPIPPPFARTHTLPCVYFFFWGGEQPSIGRGLLIHEVSRSHSDTPNSVGTLWTSDQLVAETSTWQHTQNTHNKETSISPVGFEPTISTGKRPHTYALDGAANGIGCVNVRCMKNGASFKRSKYII